MINVALDTNIFRKKPRLDSPEFKALAFLGKNKCICLHVPFFVENEFRSYLEGEQKKKLETTITTLAKIQNFTPHGPETENLSTLSGVLGKSSNNLVKERGEAFIKWLTEVNAKRYPLSKIETSRALSAYFYGKPPLKEPKIRKDIPDAFIYQSLLAIHEKHPLHVVVEDDNLREACSNSGIACYKELSEFIENKEVRASLQGKIKKGILETVEGQIKIYLNKNMDSLIDQIEEKLLTDDYRLLSGDGLPGESNEIYVSSVGIPDSLEFDPAIEHYGDGLFVVGFSACVEFVYGYAVYKSDVYELDRKKYYIEYLNDHYSNVETTDEFTFRGRLELQFDLSLENIKTVTELLKVLSDPEVSIEELDEFEIHA